MLLLDSITYITIMINGTNTKVIMEALGIEDVEGFLIENLHYLSNHTKADTFIRYLRSKMVLSQDDQDHIHALLTTSERAAKLVDIVRYKGEKGFIAYMEVLECIYPQVYTKITGNVAFKEAKDFDLHVTAMHTSRTSVMLIQEIQKCMGAFLQDNLGQKDNIELLRKTVFKLEMENEIMIKDIILMESKLRKKEDEMYEYKTTKEELINRINNIQREKLDLTSKLSAKHLDLFVLQNRKVYTLERSLLPKIFDKKTLNVEFSSLEEHLKKLTRSLSNKHKENEKLTETTRQLLDLNKRLEDDLKKASFKNDQQRRAICGLNCDKSFGLLSRTGAVKIKKEQGSESSNN